MRKLLVALGVMTLTCAASAQTVGWRGNWTGLYPDATPVTEWHRIPSGVTAGLTFSAEKPADDAPGQPVHWGQPSEWLIIAPFDVKDAPADFDKEQIPDEANLRPKAGDKVGDREWTLLKVPRFQGTELDWVGILANKGQRNQVGYAHTWVHAVKDGRARIVVDHVHGMKLWVNGKVVYEAPDARSGLGHVYAISRQRVALTQGVAPSFDIELRKGWNRLLVKSCTSNRSEWQAMLFVMRITDADPVTHDEKNIVWVTPLPERTNSGPILVGDRIFTTAEPDELLCVDKRTGKVLWRRTNSFFDACPDAEKKTNPVLRDEVAPLAKQLLDTWDLPGIYALRNKIHAALVAMDKTRFDVKWDGHMASHFGIVGFSTQPVSDGKHVCVFVGNGVVACYDTEGNRRWIRRIPLEEYCYTSSPTIAAGNLVVNCAGIRALDLETGEDKWVNGEASGGVASLVRAVIRNTEVVVTQKGDVLRATDGHLLYANPRKTAADTGWAPATVIGDVVWLPWGAFSLLRFDFSEAAGDAWNARLSGIGDLTLNKTPDGKWVDRWTA
ncbi:MAG TPA: PQQ-binding-like beta-propeller repeat protein, partial [Planctomycetota bacterium]|nr:PQQ-binding-like beta-propeller repeat protein [Planctomycetota bacterium]